MNKSTIHRQFFQQRVSRRRIEEFFFLNENNINAISYERQIWKTALEKNMLGRILVQINTHNRAALRMRRTSCRKVSERASERADLERVESL